MVKKRMTGSWTRSLAAAAVVVGFVALFAAAVEPSVVRGASMFPTLHDGDRILVERLTPQFGALTRGDVIVLEPPGADGERYVKRIAALPGDVVTIAAGEIRVNGERFATGVMTSPIAQRITVPAESYFVVGDNVNHSFDSRVFGSVPASRVIGRVVGR